MRLTSTNIQKRYLPRLVGALLIVGLASFILLQINSKLTYAADGSGSASINPDTIAADSTTGSFALTYTAAENMGSGSVEMVAPDGWSVPQGTPSIAGYTTASTTGTFGIVEDNTDSATGWNQNTACNNGLAVDGATKHEGSASVACSNGDQGMANSWYRSISAEDWSSYTKVGFWIRVSSSIEDTDLQFAYDNNVDFGTPVELIAFGQTIPANTWTYLVLDFGTTTRHSIATYGFSIRDKDTLDNTTIWIDDILLGPADSLTFPSDGHAAVRLLQLDTSQTVTFNYGSGGGGSGVTPTRTIGLATVTVNSAASDAGTLTAISVSPVVTITSGATSQLSLNDPGNLMTGQLLGYTLARQDVYDNLATSGNEIYYLYTDSESPTAVFYDGPTTSANIITSATVADGSSTATFWYYSELAETSTITVSDNITAPDGDEGIDDATDSVIVDTGGGRGGFIPTPESLGEVVYVVQVTGSTPAASVPISSLEVLHLFSVKNSGTQPLKDVSVADDYFGPAVYVRGDANDNQQLDPAESWVYTFTNFISEAKATIAFIADASSGGQITITDSIVTTVVLGSNVPTVPYSVSLVARPHLFVPPDAAEAKVEIDYIADVAFVNPTAVGGQVTVVDKIIATATVTADVPTVPYLVHLVARADPLILPNVGGEVTYTLANHGSERITEVVMQDDLCANIHRTSDNGDFDLVLDPDEVWTYHCTRQVTPVLLSTAFATVTFEDGHQLRTSATVVTTVGGGQPIATPVPDSSPPAETVSPPSSAIVLRYGMQSASVARLQDQLKQLDLFPHRVRSTGYYFTITRRAVYDFQIKYGFIPPSTPYAADSGKVVDADMLAKLDELTK